MGKNKKKKALRAWEEKVETRLAKVPERKEKFETSSGIEVERAYFPEDLTDEYMENTGFPGEYPYTRGVQPTMYRGRFWTMRQYAGFGSAEETNKRFKYLLEQGQTGLSCAFDLPTQIGYDSDDPMSTGEVGKVGVAIDSLEDMEILLDGIPLDKVSTSMTINAPASVLLAMYIAVGEKQGVPSEKLSGTIQNDILKEYIARGTYIFPPKPSMRLITDIFAYCSENVPKWNTISISGYHIREAGSTAVQEVAFTLADAIAYVEAALEAGLDVDGFAPQLSFFFNGHNNFFEEIAKFRAARRIWSRLMKEKYGAKNPKSWQFRVHTQTGGSTLTAQQPDNNIVRVTIQALAAVLGGTQSLHTNSRDEALALPTEESARIALRTQQIIAYETGVTDTVDPLAGSYYVESLTDQIEQQVLDYLKKIEDMGGAVSAVEQGYMQREIHEKAYEFQKKVETGEEVVVGVNRFRIEDEKQPELLRVDPSLGKVQRAKLEQLRERRDNDKVNETLKALRNGARGQDNLMPLILDAVRVYATIGEICGVLREEFGEYRPV
ncbi:acyl-CoA mutase large subunit family protein [Aneurinibacillus aneurinilyticus]|jgi:methylmalonyl-CoA mutase N-terminal domain/subunit|uniref:methylmalonyl-CoA mutase n=2 Tax=Aneurinibacillus aneurinilyticus TaxID=1391 RepID=A0A848CQW9_ANEAE|nr:methylmalonyl-CoA mutase family protein [Aneurinibacillus aneurinilyticus]ERI05921.1 putative methylmalonyl-CoA mutase [Aneurinibacillus aneurinilyticus ATCC 12856]MCI1692673.1 methylmalonyl-CoA mutase family protein [Aneurinibacillus aneurinilyticus]MED0672738.1 methylmalonyl-CoA mutase family protein [Aneurinibacillus aneurinilyticus]MED0708565.1 methylmalonyl-CoA mutase family protein [Aneurinibacillus aneurinilyticus]MED0721725.1 methylmalonyl-CoA mutase family protein [Aneurinibacillus